MADLTVDGVFTNTWQEIIGVCSLTRRGELKPNIGFNGSQVSGRMT